MNVLWDAATVWMLFHGPWAYCGCGHVWLRHDVEEYPGDGSEMCCVDGCDRRACPGMTEKRD